MATQKQRDGANRSVKKSQITELRREAARPRLEIDGRSKWGKAQLIRAVGQTRRVPAA